MCIVLYLYDAETKEELCVMCGTVTPTHVGENVEFADRFSEEAKYIVTSCDEPIEIGKGLLTQKAYIRRLGNRDVQIDSLDKAMDYIKKANDAIHEECAVLCKGKSTNESNEVFNRLYRQKCDSLHNAMKEVAGLCYLLKTDEGGKSDKKGMAVI